MIPVDAITSITSDAVTINHTGEHLQGAPRYDPELINERKERYWSGYDRDEHDWGDVYNYYGYAPFWGMGYDYPPYPYYRR
jgi:hypothetical protein